MSEKNERPEIGSGSSSTEIKPAAAIFINSSSLASTATLNQDFHNAHLDSALVVKACSPGMVWITL